MSDEDTRIRRVAIHDVEADVARMVRVDMP
jgi:hypothetical protein